MAAAKSSPDNLSQAGQNLLRILIASYFLAVSIGLISGTNATPLASMLFSTEPAALFGRSAIFILAYLVLTGIWLRPAAMLLGLITFWSSFILTLGPNATAPLSDFWRDIALVGALMLTYVGSSRRNLRRSAMIRWNDPEADDETADVISPRRVIANRPSNVTRLPSAADRAANVRRVENIFRDDLEDILAS